MRLLSRAAIAAFVLTGLTGSTAFAEPHGRTPVRGPIRQAPPATYHPAAVVGEQPHEARVQFPPSSGPGGSAGSWTYQPYGMGFLGEPGAEDIDGIVLDPADYPAGSVFFVRLGLAYYPSLGSGCVRLYDASVQLPVDGSVICGAATGTQPRYEYRVYDTPPLQLASGEHVYDMQGVAEPTGGVPPNLVTAQLIIRWTE
jgi:hypothetical protein